MRTCVRSRVEHPSDARSWRLLSRRGFSLIECIIATFVLAVGFVAVASMYPSAYRGATLNANHVAALEMAGEVLARVRATPYGSPLAPDVLAPETLNMMIENVDAPITFTKTVTFARGGATANKLAVSDVATVTVTWTEGTAVGSAGVQKQLVVVGGVSSEP